MELHEVCCEFISNNIILFQHIKSCKKFLKQYGHFHVTNQPYFEGNLHHMLMLKMNVEKLNLKQNYAYNSITKHMIGFGIKLTCALHNKFSVCKNCLEQWPELKECQEINWWSCNPCQLGQ